jgi:spermidine synthase
MPNIIHQSSTIRVEDIIDQDGEASRILYFSPNFTAAQGTIKVSRKEFHVNEFTRHLTYAALRTKGSIKRALFLGLGAGIVVQAVRNLFPDAIIDIVDIDRELFDVSNRLFFSIDSPQVNLHHADAYAFLKSTVYKYDYICCDVWGGALAPPPFITDHEFYVAAKKGLQDQGIFSINTRDILHKKVVELLAERFQCILSLRGNNSLLIAGDEMNLQEMDTAQKEKLASINIDVEYIENNLLMIKPGLACL